MERKPQLTSREIRVLLIYFLSFIGIVVVYLILGWIRNGAVISSPSPYIARIAVLVPLKGEGTENGKEIIDSVIRSSNYFSEKLDLNEWDISVWAYDTGNTANSAAWAALRAAHNPNTIAIIGPMNTVQMAAVQNAVRGKNIPILSPSSTAPSLNVSSLPGVYRIPSTDDLQGPVVVDFLIRKKYTDVYLIVESNKYIENILILFNQEADGRIKIVGTKEIKATDQRLDFVQNLKDSKAKAIVYLGGSKGLGMIVQELKESNISMPIVGVDSINDPKLAGLLSNNQELFFTSPFFVGKQIMSSTYADLFENRKMKPFSFESAQATLLTLTALSYSQNPIGREAVWENLPQVTIQGAYGADLEFVDGQLSPSFVYIYKGSPQEANWFIEMDSIFRSQ